MIAMLARPDSRLGRIVTLERLSAWGRYLADTRGAAGARYDEVEPWAWSRLQQELAAIAARERAALEGRR